MLRALRLEFRARRVWIGLVAWLGCFVVCMVVSAIPLPSFGGGIAVDRPQHLAYGYLYFPVLVLPVLAHWFAEPLAWAHSPGCPRAAQVSTILMIGSTALTTLAACVTGWIADGAGTTWASVPNSLWAVSILVLTRHLLGGAWATLVTVFYGAAGLFLPAVPVLLINREPDPTRLPLALLIMVVVVAVRARGHLAPRQETG